MRGTKRGGRDQGGERAGEACHPVDARGLDGFSQGHGWQNGGESWGQHLRADARRTKEEQIIVTTPA
jgi:hypothetical protein